jgi:hypothetical protein
MDAYNPMTEPGPAAWLALGEMERIQLVVDWHKTRRLDLPRQRGHAALHVGVENQIAEGDVLPLRKKARWLMAQGLDRHEALHAIASELVWHMSGLLAGRVSAPDPHSAYFRALSRLTVRKWLRAG